MEPVGYTDVGGRKGAFKMAIKKANGRWYMYLSHLWHYGWSIVDVTDPRDPKLVKFISGASNTWNIQVTLHDNLMLTALQKSVPAWGGDPSKPQDEGVLIWDIANPEDPKQLAHWKTGASGTHRNSYPGGKYAYLAAAMPGFSSQILVILDVSDPRQPKEAGRWWMPGQKLGEPKGEGPEGFHGPANISPDGKMAALGYSPAVVNLDISDAANPKLIGKLTFSPPFLAAASQSLHTVLPLWDRNILFAASEASAERCNEALNFAGLVDNRNPARPRLMSLVPIAGAAEGQALQEFLRKGRPFRPAQRQPGDLPARRREAGQPDLSHLFQRGSARIRHQGPDPTGGERLVHPARSDRQFRPAAERRGGADRGRAGRHPRLHLHHGQELGDVDPALFRPQPAHTDGPLTQSSERVIIMTRRAAQATRGHSFEV